MMRIGTFALLAGLFLGALVPPFGTQPRFEDTLMRATVALYSISPKHGVMGGCTATSILHDSTGYVFLTADHCIDEGTQDGAYLAISPNPVYDTDGVDINTFERVDKIIQIEAEDIALVHVKTELSLPVILLGDSNGLVIGSPFEIASIPEGQVKLLEFGTVAALVAPDQPEIRWFNPILIQVPVVPGDSGSAVVDLHTHTIVAVVVGSFEHKCGVVVPVTPSIKRTIERAEVGDK